VTSRTFVCLREISSLSRNCCFYSTTPT